MEKAVRVMAISRIKAQTKIMVEDTTNMDKVTKTMVGDTINPLAKVLLVTVHKADMADRPTAKVLPVHKADMADHPTAKALSAHKADMADHLMAKGLQVTVLREDHLMDKVPIKEVVMDKAPTRVTAARCRDKVTVEDMISLTAVE
jgi:hypothetical protein